MSWHIHTIYTYQISTLHVSTEDGGPGWLNELGHTFGYFRIRMSPLRTKGDMVLVRFFLLLLLSEAFPGHNFFVVPDRWLNELGHTFCYFRIREGSRSNRPQINKFSINSLFILIKDHI
jgi:hypothetical protein